MNSYLSKFKKIITDLKIKATKYFIYVSICEQKLYFFSDSTIFKIYNISTSRAKPSCVENSLGTPLGLHKIDGKIGENEPINTVFYGRVPSGLVSQEPPEKISDNMITSRILRLRGLELGKNCGKGVDTYDRFVYIHGTNQEDKIGQVNSHGCVLLSNKDVIELFNIVEDGSLVFIDL